MDALYCAYRPPRVLWYAKVIAVCVVAYAFSPIDLIPDPIPILGYLDDLVLMPLGVALVLRVPLISKGRWLNSSSRNNSRAPEGT